MSDTVNSPMKQLGTCCAIVFLFSLSGCDNVPTTKETSPESETPEVVEQQQAAVTENLKEQKPFQPFYVYSNKGARDNHYIPSGFMPNGNCLTFNDRWQEGCRSGKTCIKIEYDIECSRKDQKWAGIYWLNPANNWGRKKGGYNLEGASKLTFWAKGDEGGEQVEEFIVGGVDGGDYPDSDTAVLGPVILTQKWRQYTVDLRGKDLSYISGGFAWATNEEVNPESCTFYLDDIRYE